MPLLLHLRRSCCALNHLILSENSKVIGRPRIAPVKNSCIKASVLFPLWRASCCSQAAVSTPAVTLNCILLCTRPILLHLIADSSFFGLNSVSSIISSKFRYIMSTEYVDPTMLRPLSRMPRIVTAIRARCKNQRDLALTDRGLHGRRCIIRPRTYLLG